MYPFERAMMVQVLGRKTAAHQPDGEMSPVQASKFSWFPRLRHAAGLQLMRLGESVAGRQTGTSIQLAGETRR